jgi:zinc protease
MRHLIILCLMMITPASALASLEAESYMLKNGMQVVLIPNHKAPVVSHMVWYHTGAKDEAAGKSGMAHFLEHLLFKGTAKYASGELSKKVAQFGGNNNAFTSQDFTAYYQNIAKEKLELVMDLESDRMENLLFMESTIEKERSVILEERNMRVENNPSALLGEQMRAALFQNHQYGTPIIGWRHEIEALTLEDLRDFYLKHYTPSNATLVISGDIEVEAVKPLIAQYYEGILPGEDIKRTLLIEPPHITPIHLSLTHANVNQERFYRYYLAPSIHTAGKDANVYALSLLARLLGGSITSTLYTELVEKQKIAVDAGASYDDLSAGSSIFSLYATPAPGVSLTRLEKAIDQILTDSIAKGFDKATIIRNKELMAADTIYAQEDLKTLAYIYGQVMSLGLKPDYVTKWTGNIQALSNKDIIQAAQHVFKPEHSVTGFLLPEDNQ